MKKIMSLLTFLLLLGCASSSSILIGKARLPISPDDVKLYIKPPSKYEEIAILDSSSRSSWAVTDQGKMNVAIQRLKEEAAKIGANGILINGTGNESSGGGSNWKFLRRGELRCVHERISQISSRRCCVCRKRVVLYPSC